MIHAISRIRNRGRSVSATSDVGPVPDGRRSGWTTIVGSLALLAGLPLGAPGAVSGQAGADAVATIPEPGSTAACPAPDSVTRDVSGAMTVVRYLADDALEGRRAGSPGARCAAGYLAAVFREIGLRPPAGSDDYFRDVPLASAVNPHAPGGTGHNVVGVLEGADPDLRDRAVVVGAHYDHLGHGGFGSVHPEDHGQIHNGADDNASGVAALIEVARALTSGPRPDRTVVFVAFTGEEYGLLGSSAYVKDPVVPLERTDAMLNMDMVGRLGSDPLIVYGTGTADEWEEILGSEASEGGIELSMGQEGFGPSDHTSFYARDIPVLHFFTNVHGDYHRPSDDWQKIDAQGLDRVAGLVSDVARRVASRSGPLTLREGAGAPPSGGDEGGGYGAYLGTIPDFAPVDRGVRLSGVSVGSPAERAGLRQGDVIVGFDGEEVADLYALTDALRAHAAGDTVDVTVLREGEERTLTAVLGSRDER